MIGKRIIIWIPWETFKDLRTPILDINIDDVFNFNTKHAHVRAIRRSWEDDSINIALRHPEFDRVPEGAVSPYFTIDQAKKRYPFLFVDTNPLLYRKF